MKYHTDLERGLQNRRKTLGNEWVDRSFAHANEFNADFQNLTTRFAWHEIWGRPGLKHKSRYMIALAMTIAMGNWDEYELHVKSALCAGPDEGLSTEELSEVLMQSAIYAGIPAANTAYARALQCLRELGAEFSHALVEKSPFDSEHSGYGYSDYTSDDPKIFYSVRKALNTEANNGRPRTVVLSHALGSDLSMWDALAEALRIDFNVISYDHRGHGRSAAPEGPYSIADLTNDAARLIRELNLGPVSWIGLSMGGMVGQELAIRHPELVDQLIIANSTSSYPEAAKQVWAERVSKVKADGIESIADAVMLRYFNEPFRNEEPAQVAAAKRLLVSCSLQGYMACCQAVAGVNTADRLHLISAPTLVIAGADDQGTPVAMSEAIQKGIKDSQLTVLENASHVSVIEQPKAFINTVLSFLK